MTYQLAVDIGGTFTDLAVRTADEQTSFKAPTTPGNLTDGVFAVLESAAAEFDESLAGFLGASERLIHGTTVATNAIIEDDVDATALITTAGFGDTLLFREGGKRNPFDWDMPYPEPYIPRDLTFEIDERVAADGEVVEPISLADINDIVEQVAASRAEAVAVCLLWAHVNPEHERQLANELMARLDIPVAVSHEVNPIIREYRRMSATAIDASIARLVEDYFTRLQTRLAAAGYEGEPLIVSANGGVLPIDEILETPIWTVDAGPTMLPVAARAATNAALDAQDIIALDMGGTSLDMGVVRDGEIPRTRDATVGDDYMLGIEKVAVRSIGSGGGSIAWVDDGGLLHVGPESAGAEPGPACYGRGGDRPTVTDAALVLGYLNPAYFLGGEMTIDRDAAVRALARDVGDPLGIDATEAARSVYATATQDIVNGIKDVTIERGIDPRQYTLSGGGGALGLHAGAIARELQISDILLPADAGVVCAAGGLLSDVRRDFSATRETRSDNFDLAGVNEELGELASDARAFLERIGVPDDARELRAYAEARYPGQVWELEVPLPTTTLDAASIETVVERFHDVHEQTYQYRQADQPVEFLYWRVEATGTTGAAIDNHESTVSRGADVTPYDEREAQFGDTRVTAPAYRATSLAPSSAFEGPAFFDGETTTVVLPPAASLRVTPTGSYHLQLD